MSLSGTPEFILPQRMRKSHKSKAEQARIAARLTPSESVDANDGMSLSSFLHAPDSSLRLRYGKTLDKDEALRELARLRKICEVAATEINQRLVPDESQCYICHRQLPPGMKVTMMINVRDPETGTVTTSPLCSIDCVKEWNKVKMGLAELIK